MSAPVFLANRPGPDWQPLMCPFARNDAEHGVHERARLYMEVPS